MRGPYTYIGVPHIENPPFSNTSSAMVFQMLQKMFINACL